MIKKLIKKLFGKRKVVDDAPVEEKPRPSLPETAKIKSPESKRAEISQKNSSRNKKQPNHNKRRDNRKHEASEAKESQPKPQNTRHRHEVNHKPGHVKVEPSKPEMDWELPETPEVEEGAVSFYSLGLSNPVLHGIYDLGFKACTDIQSSTLPEALKLRDIAGKAQTGTGKTAAFLISIFDYFVKNPLTEPYSGTPRCLIIAPTRELAVQIGKDATILSKYCDAKVLTVFGGMDYRKQAEELESRVDVLVATPGRLLDYAKQRIVKLSKVEILVIDEADRMLDMGFIPDVRRIIGHLPYSDKRITQLYSATLSDAVMNLARIWMKKDYHIVEIDPDTVVSEDVEQIVYMVTAKQKIPIILWYLKNEDVQRLMIFSNRRDETKKISDALFKHGIDLELLTGDVPQKKRMSILERFRSGELKVVVCTDVAGRGIHVDNVSHVVNYELPYEPEDYVHRVGRTGRAGAQGRAISFACENSAFELPSIEEYIGHSLKCVTPEEEMTNEHEVVRELPPRTEKPRNNRQGGGRNNNNRQRRGNGRQQRR
ncbi:MAG: DEAD/DEAH box helicase [Lentisphaeraceae bacterium]|nr:DEAD/DEAH box helicase [Lentisphaeraceae bacterium]